jgi:hypothetical protein
MLVHAFELDDAQHDHGLVEPRARATIEAIDRELGALLADLQRSPAWPRTTFVVVSDHGFAPTDHEIRLGALFVRHRLIRTDGDGAPTAADVGMIASGGSALIYVLDPERREAIDAALAELGPALARRIEHDELVALGGDPHASFALVAAPGHGFSDKRTGDVIAAISPHGNHGWPPSDPAMAASLIAFGPRVPHVALGTVDMVDIAPTIARWLGVPLPTATGHPIAVLVSPMPGRSSSRTGHRLAAAPARHRWARSRNTMRAIAMTVRFTSCAASSTAVDEVSPAGFASSVAPELHLHRATQPSRTDEDRHLQGPHLRSARHPARRHPCLGAVDHDARVRWQPHRGPPPRAGQGRRHAGQSLVGVRCIPDDRGDAPALHGRRLPVDRLLEAVLRRDSLRQRSIRRVGRRQELLAGAPLVLRGNVVHAARLRLRRETRSWLFRE